MNLIPENSRPGLWVNTDWQPGTPGAFAVIIGISSYDHLLGGTGNTASETFGLGQLGVSAITGYKFFCWLRDAFRCTGTTLAKCWLLLSPTPAELSFNSELGKHALSPTMQNCDDAINEWYAAMKTLDDASATKSRSFFFFSGHGLQVTEDKQIMLPQDYLRPPAENVNRALSTQNLSDGVRVLKVPHHFFFLDACRNDHDNLRGVASLDGTPVLNVFKSAANNPDSLVPLFYASASGTQAWQPPNPALGTTVYGQALLEGLQAQAGITPSCSPAPCVVNLYQLEPFVNSRVSQIMQGYNATVGQRIRLRGDSTSIPVTEVDFIPPPFQSRGWYEVEPGFALRDQLGTRTSMDWGRLHDVFGSENMSEIWASNARVCRLPQQDPANPDWLPQRSSFTIHDVERDSGTRSYRIELTIPKQGPDIYWLQLTDRTNKSFGCVLPGDIKYDPRYLFEIDLDYSDTEGGPRPISRIDVSLAPGNKSALKSAAALWEKYELMNVAVAADSQDMNRLENMLKNKIHSPLTAVVAGLILVRARRWDRLHNWMRNVANWYTYLPDGPVLWVEQLLRQSREDLFSADADDSFMQQVDGFWVEQPIRIVDYLIEIEKRGIPTTSEGLGYAARQVDMFLEHGVLTPDQRPRLELVQERLRRALRYFRSGGLFCVFAGPVEEINPGLVQGNAK